MENSQDKLLNIQFRMRLVMVGASAVSSFVVIALTSGVPAAFGRIDSLLFGFFMFLFSYFFAFYKPNMEAHTEAVSKFGEQYRQALAAELSKRSLVRLFIDRWFMDILKEMENREPEKSET